VPGFRAPGHHLLPLHEHPGALLHRVPGDIGVPVMDAPMDFSGWFEAYLGGAWYAFDARHNRPRIGRILIAHGRDAADVAISTAFGPGNLSSFRVWTDQVA
jgi:transglutaminase-like putative cysteine protease